MLQLTGHFSLTRVLQHTPVMSTPRTYLAVDADWNETFVAEIFCQAILMLQSGKRAGSEGTEVRRERKVA